MQLEWNRFLEGFALFKQYQGLIWICCIVAFVILFKKGKLGTNVLWLTSIVLGIATLFPLTAIVLLKAYTPYYNWLDLQGVFPVMLLMGYFGIAVFSYLKEQTVPGHTYKKVGKICIATVCVLVLFLAATSFHGFDKREEADEKGVPVETSKVFEALEGYVGEEELVLAAPSEILTYARLYNANWKPLYGKDLWNPKAAGYINSGYTIEYQYYEYLEQMEPELEERSEFVSLVEEGHADCIIVPFYWSVWMQDIKGYEAISLTDSHVGIIKKELLK